jgi:hypothetical protein
MVGHILFIAPGRNRPGRHGLSWMSDLDIIIIIICEGVNFSLSLEREYIE